MTRYTQQKTLSNIETSPDSLSDLDWSFSKVDTEYLTHGLHKYPAVMLPQIPANILQFYAKNGKISHGDTVYDPFIGSGTTIVESRIHGFNAIGNDINPFACLLANVKSTPLDLKILQSAITDLKQDLDSVFARLSAAYYERNGGKVIRPQQTLSQFGGNRPEPTTDLLESLRQSNLGPYWYPEPQLYHINYVRERLNDLVSIYPDDIIDFLRVVLSQVTRQVSYQRKNCFKRYRMDEEDRATHSPSVYAMLDTSLQESRRKIECFNLNIDSETKTTIFQGDSRNVIDADTPITKNSVDIVITSPPYGDHRTTVGYGEFSIDPAIITENRESDEMKLVDKNGLGGRQKSMNQDVSNISQTLADCITKLHKKEGRDADALSFFKDYAMVIEQVGNAIKPNQPVVWVVANRRMSGIEIPLATITTELCESAGFEYEETIKRGIKNKNMPQKNAKGQTMIDEYIVITYGPTTSNPLIKKS